MKGGAAAAGAVGGVAVLLKKVGGRRRKAPKAPNLAELHKPTQAVIRAGNRGFVSSPGRRLAVLVLVLGPESCKVRSDLRCSLISKCRQMYV